MTVLEARSDEEILDVRMRTREIVTQLLDAPGFISFMGVTIGRRMHTISAWETPEAARGIRSNPRHREAVARMLGPDTAAWGQLDHDPALLAQAIVRCSECERMVRQAETCACGAALPAPRSFW